MANFNQLIVDHQANLFAFLFRMCGDRHLAEDLMQEAFYRAIKAYPRFRPKEASVKTWLFSIAANLARDHWRKTQRRTMVPLDDGDLSPGPAADSQALELVVANEVRQALLALPVPQREAIVLYYYHDLSYAEIAKSLSCPIGTVRSRIHYGLAALKSHLGKELIAHE